MRTITFTHKGWIGVCPIYIADPDGECCVEPRLSIYWPLMRLGDAVFAMGFWLRTMVDPFYEPMWPIRITGELRVPHTVEATE